MSAPPNKAALLQQAASAARRAVATDQQGDAALARTMYGCASTLMRQLAALEPDPSIAAAYRTRADGYVARAAELARLALAPSAPPAAPITRAAPAPAAAAASRGSRPAPHGASSAKPAAAEGDRLYRRGQDAHREGNYSGAKSLYEGAAVQVIARSRRQRHHVITVFRSRLTRPPALPPPHLHRAHHLANLEGKTAVRTYGGGVSGSRALGGGLTTPDLLGGFSLSLSLAPPSFPPSPCRSICLVRA